MKMGRMVFFLNSFVMRIFTGFLKGFRVFRNFFLFTLLISVIYLAEIARLQFGRNMDGLTLSSPRFFPQEPTPCFMHIFTATSKFSEAPPPSREIYLLQTIRIFHVVVHFNNACIIMQSRNCALSQESRKCTGL